jgi:hypothetical protein
MDAACGCGLAAGWSVCDFCWIRGRSGWSWTLWKADRGPRPAPLKTPGLARRLRFGTGLEGGFTSFGGSQSHAGLLSSRGSQHEGLRLCGEGGGPFQLRRAGDWRPLTDVRGSQRRGCREPVAYASGLGLGGGFTSFGGSQSHAGLLSSRGSQREGPAPVSRGRWGRDHSLTVVVRCGLLWLCGGGGAQGVKRRR